MDAASFWELWLNSNVPFRGEPTRGKTPEWLASKLLADAARHGVTLADLSIPKHRLVHTMALSVSYTREEALG